MGIVDLPVGTTRMTYGNLHHWTEFADLRVPAAEFMLGELHAGVEPANAGGAAGPAYSQLFIDERTTRLYWRERLRNK